MNENNKKKLVIGLGSNIGNRYFYLQKAVKKIEQAFSTPATISSIYSTPPWGNVNQPTFLNAVAYLTTSKSALASFELLKEIEGKLGRIKNEKWGPRCIDLDILFLGDKIYTKNDITVPHISLHQRAFVLIPAAEVLPDFVHPIENLTLLQLTKNIENDTTIFE